MTWTRISDDFYDKDVINELGHESFRLHVYSIIWCNKQLTDGLISKKRLLRLLPGIDTDAAVTELILAGLWAEAGSDHLQIDWSEQESSAEVKERQAANAARNRDYRQRKAKHAEGDHSMCDPKHCPSLRRDVARDASRDTPRPVPSRPPTGDREGGAADRPERATASPCGHEMVDDRHCEMGCAISDRKAS